MTRRRRPGLPGGLAVAGGSFAASFGRKPDAAAAATHSTPGDRPPAVPAVSRCRARQHHGQAEPTRQVHWKPGRCHSDWTGTPRIVRAGPSSLNGAPHPATRGRACGAPLTPET